MNPVRTYLKTSRPSKESIADFVKSLRSPKRNSKSQKSVGQFLDRLETGSEPCASFIKEASTAKVYKVCKHLGADKCSEECTAVKVPKDEFHDFDEGDMRAQRLLQEAVRDTPASAHFNRVLEVLPSPKGPVIVLEYEEQKMGFHTLADILENVEITEGIWKSINFQLISTLYIAQQRVPGFTHNDAHTENILIVPNTHSHICTVTSPAGRKLSHFASMLIKIIDFGQMLAASEKLQTRDGKAIWKDRLWQNKMIDFQRFATWTVWDLSVFDIKENETPEYFQKWISFVMRWLDPRFFVLKGNPDAQGQFLDNGKGMGLAPNKDGAEWMQKTYGPESSFGLGNMLDDPYFDEFVVPELRFSAQAKPKIR